MIGSSESQFSCANHVDQWVRAPSLGAPARAVVFDGICPNDITQGELGDCWLLSAFASMADYPEKIKVFPNLPSMHD